MYRICKNTQRVHISQAKGLTLHYARIMLGILGRFVQSFVTICQLSYFAVSTQQCGTYNFLSSYAINLSKYLYYFCVVIPCMAIYISLQRTHSYLDFVQFVYYSVTFYYYCTLVPKGHGQRYRRTNIFKTTHSRVVRCCFSSLIFRVLINAQRSPPTCLQMSRQINITTKICKVTRTHLIHINDFRADSSIAFVSEQNYSCQTLSCIYCSLTLYSVCAMTLTQYLESYDNGYMMTR